MKILLNIISEKKFIHYIFTYFSKNHISNITVIGQLFHVKDIYENIAKINIFKLVGLFGKYYRVTTIFTLYLIRNHCVEFEIDRTIRIRCT